MYPRNFIAPDGRVFGYDSNGRMYYVNPTGTGIDHAAADSSRPAYRGSDASAAMFRPGRILQFGGIIERRGRHRHQRRHADVSRRRSRCRSQRRLRQRDDPAERQGARDRRQPGLERADRRQQLRRDLEPADRPLDCRARAARGAPVSLDRAAAARRERAGRRRRRAGPADQHQRRDLLPAVSVHVAAAARARARASRSAPTALDIGETFFVDFADAAAHQPRDAGQDRLGDAQLEHGAALRRADVRRDSGSRCRVQAPTRAADAPPGFYHAVRARRGRRAVGGADRARQRRVATRIRHHADAGESGAIRAARSAYATSLQLAASDPNGDALGYWASGLPPGLTLERDQRPHQRHADGVGQLQRRRRRQRRRQRGTRASSGRSPSGRRWQFDAVPVPRRCAGHGSASYTASASGSQRALQVELRRRHAETRRGRRRRASRTRFTRAGHLLGDGHRERRSATVPQSRSFLQVVHLPLTATRPAASSNLAGRDARQRQPAAVGRQPGQRLGQRASTPSRARSCARSPSAARRARSPWRRTGMLWVANKRSASISVDRSDQRSR